MAAGETENPLKALRTGEGVRVCAEPVLALTRYAEDGWVEVDNNIAENALRLVSLGRKNWLFFGSDHGGERGASLYSLIGTCKLNGVDPERYLHHVLDVIADWPVNRVGALLPWRVTLPA